jgi:CLIP-associating protein 1/2
VAALEDSDAHVRECARDSVVELYTGPGVTDAARADLKAAMAKKNVRKGIVESILSKLVTGNSGLVSLDVQSELSENGDARGKNKEHIPPSLIIQGRNLSGSSAAGPSGLSGQNTVKEASRPPSRAAIVSPSDTSGASAADVNPVYVRPPYFCNQSKRIDLLVVQITSSRDMEHEFANMAKAFDVSVSPPVSRTAPNLFPRVKRRNIIGHPVNERSCACEVCSKVTGILGTWTHS